MIDMAELVQNKVILNTIDRTGISKLQGCWANTMHYELL